MDVLALSTAMLAALRASFGSDAGVFFALDSYHVLELIDQARGQDVLILNVADDQSTGSYAFSGMAEHTLELYVARSFGLSEIDESINFIRGPGDRHLYALRDQARDVLRALPLEAVPALSGAIETRRLKYVGSEKFEPPYNLRAAAFKLTFRIVGALPTVEL